MLGIYDYMQGFLTTIDGETLDLAKKYKSYFEQFDSNILFKIDKRDNTALNGIDYIDFDLGDTFTEKIKKLDDFLDVLKQIEEKECSAEILNYIRVEREEEKKNKKKVSEIRRAYSRYQRENLYKPYSDIKLLTWDEFYVREMYNRRWLNEI